MAENKSAEQLFDELLTMKWSSDDRFNRVFLFPEEAERQRENLSQLRRLGAICTHERIVVQSVIKHGSDMYREFLEKITNQPRVDAQKFIGKKNVRLFIFNRDGNVCLRCGGIDKLSLDHIIPVNKKGENKLMNLQTLCCSCNSWKSDKIIDFRQGARCLSIFFKYPIKPISNEVFFA